MTEQRLILWDVDGTLIRAGEVGADVFDDAIEHVLGKRPAERIRMGGKTDPQIVREYLALLEVAEAEPHVDPILRTLEERLAASEHLIRERGTVLPGVEDILAALHADDRVLQSVLTGNVAPNAVVKLAAFGLDRWLDLEVGAYGSDHHDRRELVPVAIERADQLRGRRFSPETVWVVGDTPNDLACARAAGARCLLVATGRIPYEELRSLPADAVREDLSAVSEVVTLLRS